VFLKSLTLRGFKSFADKTVLEFEPGVMVVVGPNGSGKSNLVDAVAWVLGAQGPRTLRGGKMDDVIFAGTAGRPALGRAEVSLTIDNTSGVLPIEFSEVTITRTLFRNGDSEYAINGAPCRLLDIQELLSDSGIGRQQHVIVGQGQIDAVLNARAEDRRAVIEEAAGVLKYRKRREKAERRLEATEGNLLRLNDLLREVRRGLAPLQKQADAARRHDGLVEELRNIRLYLVGHELAGLEARTERLRDTKVDLARQESVVQAKLRELDLAVLDAERALAAAGHGELSDALVRVESLRERARGLRALIAEKRRGVERGLEAAADEGVVETLVADAGAVRNELRAVEEEAQSLDEPRRRVEEAERRDAAARAAFGQQLAGSDAISDAAAARRELAARRDALAGAHRALEAAEARLRQATERLDAVAGEIATLEQEERERASQHAPLEQAARAATARRAEADTALQSAEARWREAESESSRWKARAEALAQALDAAHHEAGFETLADLDGVVGPLVDLVQIESGAEAAISCALGDALRAVVVDGGPAARAALQRLAAGDAHGFVLVVDHAAGASQTQMAPAGTRPLVDCVTTSQPGLQAALARLLSGWVLADGGWSSALDVALAHPAFTVVTRGGDRFGGSGPWRLGGDAGTVTRAALDEAREQVETAETLRRGAEAGVRNARYAQESAVRAEREANDAARTAALAAEGSRQSLERLRSERAARQSEVEGLGRELESGRDAVAADRNRCEELEERLPALEAQARVAQQQRDAREEERAELEAREAATAGLRRDLEVRAATIDERRTVLARRLAEVEERLARDPEAKAAAERHRAELTAKDAAYRELEVRLAERASLVDDVLARLREQRRLEAEQANEAGARLDALRKERADLERQLTELRERQQRSEIEQAETRTKLEAAVERIRSEFDCEPAAALDAPAPEVPEGTTPAGRARDLERELRIMGPINPLALEEYDALQERHEFLSQQLEDVKNTRRELQRVIKVVDQEIVTVFEAAYRDVEDNFQQLFTTLFPGGSGRIFLTDPGDLLNTGIEIEARPSGKNTRRLSLLSGGERSLTAMAYLFSVFRARPSPFYLLDEVEAALDDVNLHRFLDLVHEFRDEAQLLIVSHQKRTMEAGDCLYGVSMAPGASSRVVSQKMTGEIVLAEEPVSG
jgi:chromosome segregation protein